MSNQPQGYLSKFVFSELSIGMKHSIDVHVSQKDIEMFAEHSGDVSPIHVDDEFAKSKGFESRVAHGALLTSYVSRLIGTLLPGENGLLQSVSMEFRKPCYADTDLRITGEVTHTIESINVIKIKIVVANKANDEIVATGKVQSGINS